jgi:hypothetical protein
MRGIKEFNLFFIVLVSFSYSCVFASETKELKVKIKAYSSEIKIGEPLLLEIKVTCKTPNIDSETGEIITTGGIKPYLILNKKGQEKEIKYKSDYSVIDKPLPIYDKQKKGLEFTGSLFVFYDYYERCLFFKEPGVYSCRLESTIDKIKSNTIKINVKPPGKLERKVMSILTEKFDIAILGQPFEGMDLNDKSEPEAKGIIDRYIQVVEQCPDTMIAKMAASILGIEYFKNFHEEHKSFEIFREELKTGNTQEPLLDQSEKYLAIGSKLPDEFPVRPEVITKLSQINFMRDNFDGMLLLINELAEKYPNTKYGKQAINALKEEIPKLKAEIESK